MKLYFKDGVTIAATIMLLLLAGYIIFCIATRKSTEHWGMRSLILLIFGLVVCCFAATRDGLDKTIQNAIDGSCDVSQISSSASIERVLPPHSLNTAIALVRFSAFSSTFAITPRVPTMAIIMNTGINCIRSILSRYSKSGSVTL